MAMWSDIPLLHTQCREILHNIQGLMKLILCWPYTSRTLYDVSAWSCHSRSASSSSLFLPVVLTLRLQAGGTQPLGGLVNAYVLSRVRLEEQNTVHNLIVSQFGLRGLALMRFPATD